MSLYFLQIFPSIFFESYKVTKKKNLIFLEFYENASSKTFSCLWNFSIFQLVSILTYILDFRVLLLEFCAMHWLWRKTPTEATGREQWVEVAFYHNFSYFDFLNKLTVFSQTYRQRLIMFAVSNMEVYPKTGSLIFLWSRS